MIPEALRERLPRLEGLVGEEVADRREVPGSRGSVTQFPIRDRPRGRPEALPHLLLEEAEVEPAGPEVVPEGPEFGRVLGIVWFFAC